MSKVLQIVRIFHGRNKNKSTTNLHRKSTQILDVNLQLSVTKRAKDPTPVPHSIFLTGHHRIKLLFESCLPLLSATRDLCTPQSAQSSSTGKEKPKESKALTTSKIFFMLPT